MFIDNAVEFLLFTLSMFIILVVLDKMDATKSQTEKNLVASIIAALVFMISMANQIHFIWSIIIGQVTGPISADILMRMTYKKCDKTETDNTGK